MTKQIASIKIPINLPYGPTLRKLLRFYQTIRESNCKAYFTIDGRTYSMEKLIQGLSALRESGGKEILVVLEGEEAEYLHQQLLSALRILEENARENPGLYRESRV